MKDDTAIRHNAGGGTTFTGDAVELYRRANILMALKLYNTTGMKMTRGATIGHLLALATQVTGVAYSPRSKAQRLQAQEDMRISVETLKAAIPHINSEGKQL